VSQRLNQKFAEAKVLQEDPIAAFCAAYFHELGDASRIAAKASLKRRMNLDKVASKLQYYVNGGTAFYQLYKFHRACSATASQTVSGTRLTWITKDSSTWWYFADRKCTSKCQTHDYDLGLPALRDLPRLPCMYRPENIRFAPRMRYSEPPPPWAASTPYHDYITRALNVLQEHPCREAVTGHHFLSPSYKAKVCDSCQLTSLGLPEFSRLLGDEVERRVSKVVLELPF